MWINYFDPESYMTAALRRISDHSINRIEKLPVEPGA
jgi:hypothetical protein